MNNSVVGFLWWKTKSLSGLSLKVQQDAFLIPGCEHEVLRSLYVAPRSPPLMSAESALTNNKCAANKQVRSRCYSAALQIKTSPSKRFARGQMAVFLFQCSKKFYRS